MTFLCREPSPIDRSGPNANHMSKQVCNNRTQVNQMQKESCKTQEFDSKFGHTTTECLCLRCRGDHNGQLNMGTHTIPVVNHRVACSMHAYLHA